mmetsp:Transcript_22480/g.70428  ORF Transcript_22480/g.70428 Transcript_22480/m.70428 type:complete len:505 (+) Transcript_22480:221-1735(+)
MKRTQIVAVGGIAGRRSVSKANGITGTRRGLFFNGAISSARSRARTRGRPRARGASAELGGLVLGRSNVVDDDARAVRLGPGGVALAQRRGEEAADGLRRHREAQEVLLLELFGRESRVLGCQSAERADEERAVRRVGKFELEGLGLRGELEDLGFPRVDRLDAMYLHELDLLLLGRALGLEEELGVVVRERELARRRRAEAQRALVARRDDGARREALGQLLDGLRVRRRDGLGAALRDLGPSLGLGLCFLGFGLLRLGRGRRVRLGPLRGGLRVRDLRDAPLAPALELDGREVLVVERRSRQRRALRRVRAPRAFRKKVVLRAEEEDADGVRDDCLDPRHEPEEAPVEQFRVDEAARRHPETDRRERRRRHGVVAAVEEAADRAQELDEAQEAVLDRPEERRQRIHRRVRLHALARPVPDIVVVVVVLDLRLALADPHGVLPEVAELRVRGGLARFERLQRRLELVQFKAREAFAVERRLAGRAQPEGGVRVLERRRVLFGF